MGSSKVRKNHILVNQVRVANVNSRLEGALTQVALFSRSDILLHRTLGLLIHHLVLIATLDLLASRAWHDGDLSRLSVGVLDGRDASTVVFFVMLDFSTGK